jgi:hypothetical protein
MISKQRAGWWGAWLSTLLAFVAMTVFMTWPLISRMRDSVVGHIGDNVYFVWLFAWFRRAIFELHTSPFHVPQLNYPEGWSLAYTEMSPATIALGFPASLVGGPVFGYNFALLTTFVLSALFMSIWVHHLTKNRLASLVAGALFAFLPYRMAHFRAGHLNLVGTMWLPLYFMGLIEMLGRRKVSRWWMVLTGVSLGLTGLSSIQYLYMTSIVSIGLVAAALILRLSNRPSPAMILKRLSGAALIASPLIFAAILPFLQLTAEGGLQARSVFSVAAGSASLTDFVLPSTDHFIWGKWVGERFSRLHWVEVTLYLGALGFALALIPLIRLRDMARNRNAILLISATGAVAFVLALGTHLHWNEEIVDVSLPVGLHDLIGRESLHVRLPGFFLFQAIPFYSILRVFKRYGILVLMAMSALAGMGVARTLERGGRRVAPIIGLSILALVFLDFYPGPYEDFAKIEPRPVDYWLAEQPGDGAVAQFPFDQVQDQIQIYYTLTHSKPFLGGFFNAFPPPQFRRIKSVMEDFPDPASLDLLEELGVEYVVVDESAYADFDGALAEMEFLGLSRVAILDKEHVFLFENSNIP